jgi:hypothetical protein
MTKFSDNDSPSLLFTEQGSTPTTPAASHQRLFIRTSDHVLCYVNSSGTVTPVGSAASGSITASGYTQNTAKLLGRTTGSSGAIEEISVGSGLTLSAGSLTASGGGSGAVLGAVSYSSGADTSWKTTNSATVSDIDATNAIIAITVPASGNIVVLLQCSFYTSVAGGLGSIGVRQGSTTLGMRPVYQTQNWNSQPAPGGGNQEGFASYTYYFTGLTPGAMTLKAAFAASGSGGSTLNIMAYDGASGHNGPIVMVAWAA